MPFTFEIVDPSGNSFVQNPNAPNPDVACVHETFMRSVEDYQAMGYTIDDATLQAESDKERLGQTQQN